MGDIASLFVGPVVEIFKGWIIPKLRNITSSAERVRDMKKKMEEMEGERADIERRVESNEVNNREIPERAKVWLKTVKKIKEDVDKISSDDIGCFNLRKKYRAGKNALTHIVDIGSLLEDSKGIIWRDNQIPLGRVDSKRPASASTSTSTSGGNTQIGYESRNKIFDDALKLLQSDDKTRVVALCGMGGVGKTTLMKQLKVAAKDKKRFSWIVEVVIGKSPNLLDIQQAISEHTGDKLTETNVRSMATHLSKRFEAFSENNKKCLVILDDLWEESNIKLEDIGLASPLPNVVKLLLTSRNVQVCRDIAVVVDADIDSVLKVVEVDVLKEDEAQDLFCRIAGISAEHDHDLYNIGCEIVKKCGCLPLAIKLIAATLNSQKDSGEWNNTLRCLKNNELQKNVQEIIEISYKSLKQDDRAIFLLCGLFPEDSNIAIEDLTRYAWGLKLLNKVFTIKEARDSTKTSLSNLKKAYLLLDGDSRHSDCVKFHDLVLSFVVATVSKGGEEGCCIIHHDEFSKWSEDVNMSQSCKRISLACNGMSEFPSDFKFPNLTVLKLMQGDESPRFPQDFYVGMEKLQVIAFEKFEYPLVPTPFQFSANLRTLCLHECSLMFDLTCIGNLSNLEVLSFANSRITILPSTFGKLKKLRLLDVTGCYNLVIEDGVLKNMVKLEELYMIAFNIKACCFTDKCNELAERSKHLSALEFEFIGNNAHMKNMSFEKLNRFTLSVGCYYSEFDKMKTSKVDTHSYLNSLKLVTNREELLTSKINELFKMTDALYLQVNDMNTLEAVDVESLHPRHHPRNSSFYNLRFLVVSECVQLKCLFTLNVAKSLSKLEYLEVSKCPIMEEVIHSENDGSDIIKFSNLKYLRLAELPKLLCFSNNIIVIELARLIELQLEGLQSVTNIYPSSASSSMPSDISHVQSLFHEEDATPKLEKLFVYDMENLKEIWPPQFSVSNLCMLRELEVWRCHSIEVLFKMDFGQIEQLSSSLRSIQVDECKILVKLFSCNPFPFLNSLQELKVESCCSITVLFGTELGRAGKSVVQVCSSRLRSIVVKKCVSLVNLLPRNPMPLFNNLEEVEVKHCASIEVLFNIHMGGVGEIEELVCSSRLRSIKVKRCDRLVKLFSCNPFPFFNNLQELEVKNCGSIQVLFDTDSGYTGKSEEQVCSSSLRSIKVSECNNLVNLLPRNPMPLFNNLEELRVIDCASVEVIFSMDMGCVGETDKVSSSSRLRSVTVERCDSLVNLFPVNLEVLEVTCCASIEVIFDIDMRCVGKIDKLSSGRLRRVELKRLGKLREVWRIKDDGTNLIHGFEAIEIIDIKECESFENIITPATTIYDMTGLKQVSIIDCGGESERNDEMVVSKQNQEIDVVSIPEKELNDDMSKVAFPSSYLLHTFHHLHKLVLREYKRVEVVFEIASPSSRDLSPDAQQPLILPYLEELLLDQLDRMSYVWKCNWNEFLILKKPQSQSSFHNLTTITMSECNSIKYLFSPLMAKLLSSLKKVHLEWCDGIEEVVSNRDDHEDSSIYSHTDTTLFPHLDILYLEYLENLECIGGDTNGISTDIHDQHKLSQAGWSLCQYARDISIIDCDVSSSVYHDQIKLSQVSWSWSLCQYAREISVRDCFGLVNVIPRYAAGQMQKLQVLEICNCISMVEVFETQETNNESGTDHTGKSLPRLEYITIYKLPKLNTLKIHGCGVLKHVFTFSTLESLTQLEELEIKDCEAMEVIVKKDNEEQTTASDVVVFPRLKSLALVNLPTLVGFFLGTNEFSWPTLEKVVISECPQFTVFTYGRSTAPKLNFMNTSLGKHSVECGLNFRVTTTSHQARLPSYESTSSYRPTTMERLPWSYHDLIEVDMGYNPRAGRETLFSSDKLLQLQKLESLRCKQLAIEEIFDSQTVAEIPNLRQVDLTWLSGLKYIWKSKQGTVLKFPNLTRLSIDGCHSLEYVFTCPMVGSILQLQELHISDCKSMKVIVKGEEECDAIVDATVVFPCLKFIQLDNLECLEGFCLGKEAFEFSSLDDLKIDDCKKMTIFTKGDLSAPKLYAINSRLGYYVHNKKYNIHNRLNSFMNTFQRISS